MRDEDDTKWRDDEVTEKQVRFLIELGESKRNAQRMTKGEASDRIDELLEKRDEAKAQAAPAKKGSSVGGCAVLFVLAVLVVGCVTYCRAVVPQP